MESNLAQRIERREALVGIIGMGYVGLPLARALHDGGLPVLGFDIDPAKVAMLARGESYLRHLGGDFVQAMLPSGRFSATTDFNRLDEPDVIIVCVPTPLGRHQEPDLSYVVNSGRDIGARVRPGQLAILESTTYPGTTRGEFLDAILSAAREHDRHVTPGRDLFVAFSPEREDPGRRSHSTSTIPKLVGGLDPASTRLAAMVYRAGVSQVVEVSSAEVAESAKLLENIFRAVNIALVNELKVILTEMGVDVWEVVEAASTKPFGFMPFFPGPGLGGHCIPIDPFYLTWKAREIGRPTKFIELAGEVNTSMPAYVVDRLAGALNERGRPVRGSRVLVLGLAYKADIDDTRESPSFELIERLRRLGAEVDYSDPHIPKTVPVRKHDLQMASVTLTPESLAAYDAVLVSTAHTAFDWALVARHARLVVDTRNALKPYRAELGERLVLA
ncbi:MAG: nucleotide sugar dehydrogenase [Phycisphaerales bacterium]|jgi:UDP-N-acetyl-D-glucosamine dehydrogenase|nr:nucleotide sugar dehydrogenase [Phycisphaerales bacterium]